MSTLANLPTFLPSRPGGDEAGAVQPQSNVEAADETIALDFASALAAFAATLVPPPAAPTAAPATIDPAATSAANAIARDTAATNTALAPQVAAAPIGSDEGPAQPQTTASVPEAEVTSAQAPQAPAIGLAAELPLQPELPEGPAKAKARALFFEPGSDQSPHDLDTLEAQLAAKLPPPGTRVVRLANAIDPTEFQPQRPLPANLRTSSAPIASSSELLGSMPQSTPPTTTVSMTDEASLKRAATAVRESRLFEVRQAQFGSDRAELLIGWGEDGIRLSIHARAARIRVTATVPSSEAAFHLKDNLYQLGQALTRHGLSLDGFSIETPPAASGTQTGGRDANSGQPDDPRSPPVDPEAHPGAAPEHASASSNTPQPATGICAIA